MLNNFVLLEKISIKLTDKVVAYCKCYCYKFQIKLKDKPMMRKIFSFY